MNDLIYSIVLSCLIFIFIGVFFILFIFKFNKRQTQHRLEKASLKAQYEAEILNAENEIQESTMKHISRELHDNVGQLLTLVKIQLNKIAQDHPEITKIANSRETVATALTDVRALSKSLNNDNLLQEGLAKAIDFELDRISKTGEYTTKFNNQYEGNQLDHKKEILIFRMFQELVQNCLKHAQAKNITVNLVETKEFFNLEFKDDGIGFDFNEKTTKNGFGAGAGLKNLAHRAKLLGGNFEIKTNHDGGIIASIIIPLLPT